MRKILFFIYFLYSTSAVHSQIMFISAQPQIDYNKKYSYSHLTLNLYKNQVELSKEVFGHTISSASKFIKTDNIYVFRIFHIQKIRLKVIDKYRLLVLDKSFFFDKNEILYCHDINDCNNNMIELGMYWKNGLRDGSWDRYTEKGVVTTVYQNGEKIRVYFRSYKEIEEAASKLPKL